MSRADRIIDRKHNKRPNFWQRVRQRFVPRRNVVLEGVCPMCQGDIDAVSHPTERKALLGQCRGCGVRMKITRA